MGDQSTYERLKALGYGSEMREEFSLDEEYIQLNHGSVSRCCAHSITPSVRHATVSRSDSLQRSCARVNGLTRTACSVRRGPQSRRGQPPGAFGAL